MKVMVMMHSNNVLVVLISELLTRAQERILLHKSLTLTLLKVEVEGKQLCIFPCIGKLYKNYNKPFVK